MRMRMLLNVVDFFRFLFTFVASEAQPPLGQMSQLNEQPLERQGNRG